MSGNMDVLLTIFSIALCVAYGVVAVMDVYRSKWMPLFKRHEEERRVPPEPDTRKFCNCAECGRALMSHSVKRKDRTEWATEVYRRLRGRPYCRECAINEAATQK